MKIEKLDLYTATLTCTACTNETARYAIVNEKTAVQFIWLCDACVHELADILSEFSARKTMPSEQVTLCDTIGGDPKKITITF